MARGGPKLHHQRRYELGQSFQDGGEHYDRVRPGYPADSADWLIGSIAGAADAADVGAGTGKFTALLVQRGLAVSAVDPSPDMLAQLRLALPGVPATEGTAEATGLADGAFDVVSVAQAWHWCDPAAGQHGTFPHPPPRRRAGADLEPAGYVRPVGPPALPDHACRRCAQAGLPPGDRAGVHRAGEPPDTLGRSGDHRGHCRTGQIPQLLPGRR